MTAKKPNARKYFRGPMSERLKFHSQLNPETGCIIWTGALSRGYGYVGDRGKVRSAHIIAYELVKGQIPKGLELDHLCRVRRCINPDHLEPVTRQTNILRGIGPLVTKAKYKAMTHCKRGHEFTPENTYRTKNGRRQCRACHRLDRFGPRK